MRKLIMAGWALAIPFVAAGCADSHEKVMKDAVAVANELCGVLEEIKTADDVDAHRKELEKLAGRLADIRDRAIKLGTPDDEKDVALQKQFDDDLKKIRERFARIEKRIRDPKVQEKLEEIFKDADLSFLEFGVDVDDAEDAAPVKRPRELQEPNPE